MTYDFSHDVHSPKVEDVYPPLFLGLYAELKDILRIDDVKALHKFLNDDLAASMEAEVVSLLPPLDWASQDNLVDFVSDLMSRSRERFEDIYKEEYTEANGRFENMDLNGIVYELQVHMASVATYIAEMVVAAKDTRIEKETCVLEKTSTVKTTSAFLPVPDREEYKYAYDIILPWLDFPSLTQVAGFLFRGDQFELSEVIADEFDYLCDQEKYDLEDLIDATLDKISEDQKEKYHELCGGLSSVRHGMNNRALGAIRQNLKLEMKFAAANIAEGVLAVQDSYIFPEDRRLDL